MQAPLFPNIKRSSLLYRAIVLFCFLGLLNTKLVFSDDCPNADAHTDHLRIPPEVTTIADLSKEALGEMSKVTEINPVVSIVANTILSALGFLGDNNNMHCELLALHQHLDEVAQKLVWLDTQEAREQRLADMLAAVKEVKAVIRSDVLPVPLYTPGMRDNFLSDALTRSDVVMQKLVPDDLPVAQTPFIRTYSEYATDGEVTWKAFIKKVCINYFPIVSAELYNSN